MPVSLRLCQASIEASSENGDDIQEESGVIDGDLGPKFTDKTPFLSSQVS